MGKKRLNLAFDNVLQKRAGGENIAENQSISSVHRLCILGWHVFWLFLWGTASKVQQRIIQDILQETEVRKRETIRNARLASYCYRGRAAQSLFELV